MSISAVWLFRATHGLSRGGRLRKTFTTITAAKQWRTDATVALRAGTMTTDRGPTLNEAVDIWLDALRGRPHLQPIR